MKWSAGAGQAHYRGRTPQGVRGLKSSPRIRGDAMSEVAPRKGCVD